MYTRHYLETLMISRWASTRLNPKSQWEISLMRLLKEGYRLFVICLVGHTITQPFLNDSDLDKGVERWTKGELIELEPPNEEVPEWGHKAAIKWFNGLSGIYLETNISNWREASSRLMGLRVLFSVTKIIPPPIIDPNQLSLF